MNTNYNKAVIMLLGIAGAVGTAILSATGATGLSPVALTWIGIGVAACGAVGAALTGNAFQPTVPPGHVVVPAEAVKPEAQALIKFQRPAG